MALTPIHWCDVPKNTQLQASTRDVRAWKWTPLSSKVKVENGKLLVSGPKGSHEISINEKIFSANVSKENILSIKPTTKNPDDSIKKTWGTTRSLVNNAIIGVTSGYEKILEMTGVGHRASIKDSKLVLQLGFSHNIEYKIPNGVKILVEKQTVIKLNGNDKAQIGTVAAEIKSFRPTEPYKGKGIKERGQYVLRKEGKKK